MAVVLGVATISCGTRLGGAWGVEVSRGLGRVFSDVGDVGLGSDPGAIAPKFGVVWGSIVGLNSSSIVWPVSSISE